MLLKFGAFLAEGYPVAFNRIMVETCKSKGAPTPETQTSPWDPAEHLETEKDMAAYLNVALKEAYLILSIPGDVARARRMAVVAKETGLGRESLYKSLSAAGSPEITTEFKVVRALGLRLRGASLESPVE